MNTSLMKVIVALIVIKIVYCAPPGDMSVLEYGPGYNTYGHQQMKSAQLQGIKPLVDTIREDEKYGNDGGHIRTASVAFIKLTEGTSGTLSNILGPPNENRINLLKPFDPLLIDLGNRLGGLA